VALLALLSITELGVSLAIVRWPGDPREFVPTVSTISVAASTFICAVCYVGAPAFATAMGAPDAAPVVRVLGLSVIVSGIAAAPAAMLQRGFRQDRKTIADQISAWTSALVSVALALSGVGAMSLAVGQLVGSAVGAALFIAFAPRSLRFGFDRAKARALLKFGLPLAGSSIVVFASTNVDKVLVGAVLGPVPLGFYVLAANLSNWPATMFSLPVRSVAPALLSRLQDDPPTMRKTFLSTGGLLAAITLPACVVLAAAADPIIAFVYGTAWQPAATVLTWLGLLAALRILFELVYDYFVVLAHSRVVFTVQVIWFVALVPALWAGAHYGGAAAAALAAFAVAALVVAPIYLYELSRTGITTSAVARRLGPAALGSLGAAAVAATASRLISADLLAILVSGLAAAAVLGLLLYRMRDTVKSLRSVGATADEAAAPVVIA
jgi:PST family polysaccharide transporter